LVDLSIIPVGVKKVKAREFSEGATAGWVYYLDTVLWSNVAGA